MKLPDLSNLNVGYWRYIQSIHESGERQNPDTLVWRFVPVLERWRAALLDRKALARFRTNPFYYYVVARTKYYDGVFVDAISEDIQQIINIGCGSDTRAYRFESALRQASVKVLECDQQAVINSKQKVVRCLNNADYVEYMPLDLNDAAWPEFECFLAENAGGRMLVLMEGVSPYVNEDAFIRFLSLLANRLPTGSRVAYDFKFCGMHDDFGSAGRTRSPFRLPGDRGEVALFHENIGFRLEHFEASSELFERFLPGLAGAGSFREDGLVQLTVCRG